jgi:bile-salt sulfotransferase
VRNNYWPSFIFFPLKAIYLIRNPKDVLVFGYFSCGKTNLVKNPGSLRTYFEWFLKRNAEYPVKYRR